MKIRPVLVTVDNAHSLQVCVNILRILSPHFSSFFSLSHFSFSSSFSDYFVVHYRRAEGTHRLETVETHRFAGFTMAPPPNAIYVIQVRKYI